MTDHSNKKYCFLFSVLVDHSRVKILPVDDIEGSDYINANYIPVTLQVIYILFITIMMKLICKVISVFTIKHILCDNILIRIQIF